MTIQGIPDLGPGVRLHLNENTGGCSPAVVEAVRAFDATALASYPDYTSAVIETAGFLGVDPDRIVLTNGLDEGVLLTAIACLAPGANLPFPATATGAAVPPPEVLVALPTFDTYVSTAHALGARVVAVPATPDYSFPVDAMAAAITPHTRLIYINNPNNPSGQPVAQAAIHHLVRAAPHAVVFVDEAYHDFLGENFLAAAAEYPNVIVGRTFSKAHGLAGIRIGVLLGPPALLMPIRRAMPLFNLNVVAVAALRAALRDTTFTPWYVAQVAASKHALYAALDRVGLRYWPSAANFVLIDGGPSAGTLIAGLIARGVLVRDRSHDPACVNCFRITAGVVSHTERAIAVLEELCPARR